MSHISSVELLRFTDLGQSSTWYNLESKYITDTSYVIGLRFGFTDQFVLTHEMRMFSYVVIPQSKTECMIKKND